MQTFVIGIMWNCRGVAKKGMQTFVKDLLWEYQTDFVGSRRPSKKDTL